MIHPDHKIEYEHEHLRAKLVAAGFEIVQERGLGLLTTSLKDGVFYPEEMIEHIALNNHPQDSYVLYYECRKPMAR